MSKNEQFSRFCLFSNFYTMINFLFFILDPTSYVDEEQMLPEVWAASPPNLKIFGGLGQILEQKIGKIRAVSHWNNA